MISSDFNWDYVTWLVAFFQRDMCFKNLTIKYHLYLTSVAKSLITVTLVYILFSNFKNFFHESFYNMFWFLL